MILNEFQFYVLGDKTVFLDVCISLCKDFRCWYHQFIFLLLLSHRYWQDDYVGWAHIDPLRILAGPFCGRVDPFAFVSWGNKIDPIYVGFYTGSGEHKRYWNTTFYIVHDFSKISKLRLFFKLLLRLIQV